MIKILQKNKKNIFLAKKTCVWGVFFGQKYDFLKTCCIKSVMELVFHTNYVQYQHLKTVLFLILTRRNFLHIFLYPASANYIVVVTTLFVLRKLNFDKGCPSLQEFPHKEKEKKTFR